MEQIDGDEEDIILWALWYRKRRNTRRRRNFYVRPLNELRRERGSFNLLHVDLRLLDEERHLFMYRMTKGTFDNLLERLRTRLMKQIRHRYPISPEHRLALTLQLLAHGTSQRYQAAVDRIGQKTVNKIFNETCRVLWTVLHPNYVKKPTITDWMSIAAEFELQWNFPNCVGAIDGKHVAIEAPPNAGSTYFNYKGYHSIVLLAACDANYRFTFVDVGGYGADSDGGTFSRSSLGVMLAEETLNLPECKMLPGTETSVPHVFVADEAFPLRHNLMRPFPGRKKSTMPMQERIYNYRLSRARRTIENAFGILSARWRILRRPIQAKPENVEAIVLATVALHNFLKTEESSRYAPANFVDNETTNATYPGEWRKMVLGDNGMQPIARGGSNNYTNATREVREKFKDYFCDVGALPWQADHMSRIR